jgi:hypothetical protein
VTIPGERRVIRASLADRSAREGHDPPRDCDGFLCLAACEHLGRNAPGQAVRIASRHIVLIELLRALPELGPDGVRDGQCGEKLDERMSTSANARSLSA